MNSLSQTVIKLFAPGVPDFYQGVEFWDFSLVDPDNRRPVDFEKRRQALGGLISHAREDLALTAADLLRRWPDERLKMFVMWRGLRWRREHGELADADYQPLVVRGPREDGTFAFARFTGKHWAVVVAPRLTLEAQRTTVEGATPPAGAGVWRPAAWWANTSVELPPGAPRHWKNLFTGQTAPSAPRGKTELGLPVDEVLRAFPVAVLISDLD